MSIKSQIHALLVKHGELTMKEVIEAVGCSRDSARPALCLLKAAGVLTVTRIGSRGEKLYRLTNSASSAGLSVEAKSTIELCKERWGGYRIHKIFGSASRSGLTEVAPQGAVANER